MKQPPMLYRVSEFAEATGVTVRTLHHYDRIGLLKPSGRTERGYRLYGSGDLVRLQQIVALKFIGFPLNQIKQLLEQRSLDVVAALHLQRDVIAERVDQLRRALSAIDVAEQQAAAGGLPDVESLRKIIEVMEMPSNTNWMEKYYDQAAIAEHKKQWSPALQEKVSRDWKQLFADVEAARSLDPSSPAAQELVTRWDELVGRFTQGNPKIEAGLKKLYADRQNWPSNFQQPFNDEVCAFIQKAREARTKK